MSSKVSKLETLIRPVIESLGYEFWGITFFSKNIKSVLRIYIDKTDGVSVTDCAKVSRDVSAILDVEDPVSGNYSLEVSSPGLDRLLFTLQHYEKNTGQQVSVKLRTPFEGQRNYKGVISGTDTDAQEVHIICDKHELLLPFEMIEKANIIPRF